MIDISFTGGTIEVSTPTQKTTISEFSDEGSPLECNEIQVTGNALTLNGQLILWRRPSAYTVSVTVIPRSDNDVTLSDMLSEAHIEPNSGSIYARPVSELNATMTITCPAINESGSQSKGDTWTFTNGRIVSGPTGPGTNAEGKMSSRRYTFVFERMVTFASGMDVTEGWE